MKIKIFLIGVMAIILGGCVANRPTEPVPGAENNPTPAANSVSPDPSPADIPELEEELESLDPDGDFPTFTDQDLGL